MGRSTWRRSLERRPAQARAKNPSQLRSAVWARQKENATNQIGNVMDKPGHVSELHVQEIGASHLATARFPNYLRENSGVKVYWTTAAGSRGGAPHGMRSLTARFHTQAMTAIQSFVGVDVSPFTKAPNCINAVFTEPMLRECYSIGARMRLEPGYPNGIRSTS